jgi:hypothetical protein
MLGLIEGGPAASKELGLDEGRLAEGGLTVGELLWENCCGRTCWRKKSWD